MFLKNQSWFPRTSFPSEQFDPHYQYVAFPRKGYRDSFQSFLVRLPGGGGGGGGNGGSNSELKVTECVSIE